MKLQNVAQTLEDIAYGLDGIDDDACEAILAEVAKIKRIAAKIDAIRQCRLERVSARSAMLRKETAAKKRRSR